MIVTANIRRASLSKTGKQYTALLQVAEMMLTILLIGLLLPAAWAQPFAPGTGLLGLGDLTTTDPAGPYRLPDVQTNEVKAALAAKRDFTDADILTFLLATECLEAIFDTCAAFGKLPPAEIIGPNAPTPIGPCQKANLSREAQALAEEIALDEQGHVRFVRQVLGDRAASCPLVNLTAFKTFFSNALGRDASGFDPLANEVNLFLAILTLEEVGASGDKGLIAFASNPAIASGIAGLAQSAGYQAAIQRYFLWQRRNQIVQPVGITVLEAFQKVSDYRDSLDGPLALDQGLTNNDPQFIVVPTDNINLVPTDSRGLTIARTPQQVLRIITAGSDATPARGGFLPNGVQSRINSTAGYTQLASGFNGFGQCALPLARSGQNTVVTTDVGAVAGQIATLAG